MDGQVERDSQRTCRGQLVEGDHNIIADDAIERLNESLHFAAINQCVANLVGVGGVLLYIALEKGASDFNSIHFHCSGSCMYRK